MPGVGADSAALSHCPKSESEPTSSPDCSFLVRTDSELFGENVCDPGEGTCAEYVARDDCTGVLG
jgi:NAD-dependent SIR2 family protein deacetylase